MGDQQIFIEKVAGYFFINVTNFKNVISSLTDFIQCSETLAATDDFGDGFFFEQHFGEKFLIVLVGCMVDITPAQRVFVGIKNAGACFFCDDPCQSAPPGHIPAGGIDIAGVHKNHRPFLQKNRP
ncbi:MAG: hypothetical protein H6867_03270 [Rhodospirillales bacterium]|nr:hypothetical protein [Rhodospirillales bacterium]MCB9996172.1 hypothetical protein [Rhodospirillales bacterium]